METAQRDGQRAHDACSIAERAGANLHRPRRKLQQHARDLVRKVRTRPDRATQNEQLRIYCCDDRRGCKSSQPRSLVDHVRGKRISCLRSLKDLSDRIDLGTAGLPISPHDTSRADLILEAALQPRLGLQRIAADRQIADLAGGAVLAANELAVDVESESDAATEREEGHVGDVLRAAMPYFPEQREIDVIFKDDGAAEFLTQQAHDIEMIQAGDVGSHLDGAALGIHHTRSGQHDGANSTGMCVIVTRQTIREPGDLVEHPGSAAAVGGFVGLGEDSACNIGQGNCQSPGSQVDAEHVAAFRAQLVQHGGPSDVAARSSDRANQALLLERVDDFRDRLFRQTGHLGQVSPRDGAAV